MCFCKHTAPPSITSPVADVDITVVEGNDTVFTCTARGFPTPTITWYRGVMETERMELTGAEELIMMMEGFIVVTSTLTISSVNRRDSDVYSCVATNSVLGSSRSDMRIFNLTVNCKC